MRRLLLIAAALVAATLVATGVHASGAAEPRVGFVAYSGSVPTPHTLDGMAFVGFLHAERKLAIHGRVQYVGPTQGPGAVLRSFGRQDYDLVVAPLYDPGPIDAVSSRFPKLQFLVVDAQPGAPPKRHAKNIHRIVFKPEQAAYMAGYLSALMAARGGGKPMVSAVGGYRFYGVTRWIDGFRAGAHKADSHVVFRVDYSNDFANPSKCRRLALSQIAAGSRVVFNVAGVCGVGALRAAAQKTVWGVGVDIDQSFLGPHILTSAVSRYDRGVFDTIRRFVRGKLGATTVYDVRNGGVELGRISPKVPASLRRRVARIRREIADG
ncbi:MAG TPA: BMP family ABC transporter substrate-binding protein, partial [Coriobacteriia bacterium]